MTQFYLDPSRESEAHALPDAEVFFIRQDDKAVGPVWADENEPSRASGWYWWACFPGCLPDEDPNGPFDSEAEAVANARKGGER